MAKKKDSWWLFSSYS